MLFGLIHIWLICLFVVIVIFVILDFWKACVQSCVFLGFSQVLLTNMLSIAIKVPQVYSVGE